MTQTTDTMAQGAATASRIRPEMYVVRVTDTLWCTPMHDEHVCDSWRTAHRMDAAETLEAIAEQDVSLMVTADGDEVDWRHGRDVTQADLLAQEICS
jgi:hypothetical protein